MTPPDEVLRIADGILPGSGPPSVERAPRGASTPVYRVARAGTTRYLRLAETAEASLLPEALAHRLARTAGVRVPEVVHLESFNGILRRSVMVTAEIPGRSLAEHHPGPDLPDVLAAAGRDLARLNALPVDGFGWIRRDRPDTGRLEAELPTLHAFALDDVEAHLAAIPALLSTDEIDAIRGVVARSAGLLDATSATLAHGDLDAGHIYHRDGVYTGIIDLGEIRGADPWYDLGHLALHDGETLPDPLLPAILAGYAEVLPLPPDARTRISLWSLMIGLHRLARLATRPPSPSAAHLAGGVRDAVARLSTKVLNAGTEMRT